MKLYAERAVKWEAMEAPEARVAPRSGPHPIPKRTPKVETTFSLAMRPVTVATVDCQSPKPRGQKITQHGTADGGQQGGVVVLHHAEAPSVKAEALEEPQNDGGGHDDRAGPLDEGPAPLPGGPQHVARGGGMVGGQLHDEGRGLTGEGPGLFSMTPEMTMAATPMK